MKIRLFQLKIDKISEIRAKREKILKFYVEILKEGGHWVWTVVKNEVIVRFTKKGVIIQADDIGRNMGVPPPPR